MLKRWMIPLAVLFGSGAAHADAHDQWCATEATRPSSIVICTDPELRSLAVLRTKLLNDARKNLRHDQYQALQDDQNRWIKSYTGDCGVSINGPPVAIPIPAGVIDCYKGAGRQRVAYLIDYLTRRVPGYKAPQLLGTSIADRRQTAIEQNKKTEADAMTAAQAAELAAKAKAEQESQQAALAAEQAREQLRAQAVAERGQKITAKLKELGFQVISPIDLELDWARPHQERRKGRSIGQLCEGRLRGRAARRSQGSGGHPALYGRRVARRPQGDAIMPRRRHDRLPSGDWRHRAVLLRQQGPDYI